MTRHEELRQLIELQKQAIRESSVHSPSDSLTGHVKKIIALENEIATTEDYEIDLEAP